MIEFHHSSSLNTRLDAAIVSHFRLSGTPTFIPDNQQSSDTFGTRKTPESAAAVTLDAGPIKGQRFRGREGRQQHTAVRSQPEEQVCNFSALMPPHLMQKFTSEESRRKLYERRRAERQRLHDAEFEQSSRHNSGIDCGLDVSFEDDGEEFCAVGSALASLASISVNSNDFDYHVNVTAALASRQRVSQLIESGMVSVNGSTVLSKSHILSGGVHAICISLSPGSRGPRVSSSSTFPFPILYEDESLLVICKPSGIVVHPTPSVHDAEMPSVVSCLLQQGFLLPASQSAIHRFNHLYLVDFVFLKHDCGIARALYYYFS